MKVEASHPGRTRRCRLNDSSGLPKASLGLRPSDVMRRQSQISEYAREDIIESLLDEITGVDIDSRPCRPEMLARMGKFFKQ